MTPTEVRFAADGMLQSLATWLRLTGYDCVTRAEAHASATGEKVVCSRGVSRGSRVLLEQAVAEGRVFLTRNAHLTDTLPRALLDRAQVVYVAGEHLPEQLREVVEKFSLERDRFVFTRCVECNRPLSRQERSEATGHVPADVAARETEFWHCACCGKTFWKGSHVRNSVARLQQWLAAPFSD
jgi:uncharacterized protein with PIN domain